MKLFLFIVSSVVILSTVNCRISLKGRIVGGKDVKIRDFPYQASVRFDGRHICGAAIISSNSILTAAHCATPYDPTKLTISHGSTCANSGTIHQVTEIIQTNPAYNTSTMKNDISILKITPPIQFSNSSQPINLSKEHLVEGSEVIVSGWGKRNENESRSFDFGSRSLRAVTLRVVNFDKCRESYEEFGVNIDDRMICAAAKGRDSCQGDSGGPMIDKKTRLLAAVLSFGYGCAEENYPGTYTLLSSYVDFIKSNL